MTIHCTQCEKTVFITRKQARVWTEKAGLPFVCDNCLGGKSKRAVLASDIAKAEAHTRAFRAINLNPSQQPRT